MALTEDRRRHADRLFEAALDLRPEERPAYLDGACDGDRVLRALVERLIDAAEIKNTQLMLGSGIAVICQAKRVHCHRQALEALRTRDP